MHRFLASISLLSALSACDRQENVSAARMTDSAPKALMLVDSQDQTYSPLTDAEGRTTVLLFLMKDCPVANASAPEIARLAAEFIPRGVRFLGVYATETAAEISAHVREYGLNFPGLLDTQGELAGTAGATRVPEAAVFSPAGKLLYRGRIDDRAVRPGITKPVPTRQDLRLALEAVLAGKSPDPKYTETIGCYLPDAK